MRLSRRLLRRTSWTYVETVQRLAQFPAGEARNLAAQLLAELFDLDARTVRQDALDLERRRAATLPASPPANPTEPTQN